MKDTSCSINYTSNPEDFTDPSNVAGPSKLDNTSDVAGPSNVNPSTCNGKVADRRFVHFKHYPLFSGALYKQGFKIIDRSNNCVKFIKRLGE